MTELRPHIADTSRLAAPECTMLTGRHWSAEEDQFLYDQMCRGIDIKYVTPPSGRTLKACRLRVAMPGFPHDAPPRGLAIAGEYTKRMEETLAHIQQQAVRDGVHAWPPQGVVYPIPKWAINTDGMAAPRVSFQCGLKNCGVCLPMNYMLISRDMYASTCYSYFPVSSTTPSEPSPPNTPNNTSEEWMTWINWGQ